MCRIKSYPRSVSQLLLVGLLSCWVMLIAGLLIYWLVVLRLIKSILKQKKEKEKTEEIHSASIADIERSPVWSSKAESEPNAIPTKVEYEQHAIPTQGEPEPKTVATKDRSESDDISTIEAYCVKCHQKRVIQEARKIITQKGRRAIEGICPICGTKLFRFIAQKRKKETLQSEE